MSQQALAIRMAHLEGAYEQVSQRLTGIDTRLTGFEQRVELRFGQLDGRLDGLSEKIDQRSLWVMGLVLVSIVLPVVMRFWH